ncbi:MAG: RecX family transcriptional regulator [Bacteroidetes bacterium]|nr:RecX family transcriptional regulator [Bacteroidota bacterium]
MKITSIEKQKRRNNRYSVFIDDKFSFGVSDIVLSNYNLHNGLEIDENELIKISEMEDVERGMRIAFRYNAQRPRSEFEFKTRLAKNKLSKNVINSIIIKLNSSLLINDAEFARMFVADKLKFRPISRIKMENELLKKGISRNLSESILDKYYSESSEKEFATELAKKRFSRYFKNKITDESIKKVMNFLLRRGYSFSLISDVLKLFTKTSVY